MQEVTSSLYVKTKAQLRKLCWVCFISWTKAFNAGVTFFTIGSSTIGGIDIIKGMGDVVQEWDKYAYTDFSNRIINFEWTREQDPYIGGAVLSIADIVLDNHDDYFTPNQPGSPLGANILPWRPVRLYAGFGNEVVPVFVGLIENMPNIDTKAKIVTIHCIDFLQSIFNYPLDQALILQNNRTDQIISTLLQLAGLGPTQMSLDTGQSLIPFFFANKGDKLGPILRALASAEMGKIYMDENGVIRFLNRTNWLANTSISWVFNRGNTLERRTTTDENIINVVDIKADVRTLQANIKFWDLAAPILIPPLSSVVIWADLNDPAVTIDTPVYVTGATTSSYTTNVEADSSGLPYNANITLSSISKFAKSAKMTFANSHATIPIYITGIALFGTPAPATSVAYDRVEDATSVAAYDERPLTIENDFIQDTSTAHSISTIIIEDNKAFSPVRELDVVGVPQLQVGDTVIISDEKVTDTYSVTKIVSKMVQTQFTQTLSVVKKIMRTYFRPGISSIGGADAIAP
jgi:hypothetical protein